MGPQGKGAIISPIDYRDNVASSAALPVPTALPGTYQTKLDSPMYQRKIPACVSHSIVDLLKLYWFVKTGKWIDFSPRFLDVLSAEPDIPLDGGRRPRTVLKMLVQYGCATNKTYPNTTELPLAVYRDKSTIPQKAYDEALQYRIPGYIRIPVEYIATRQAIMTYGAVSTLFSIGSEMWLPSWRKQDIVPLRTPQIVESGHQMTSYGWQDSKYNLLQNEWSTSWADQGRNSYDTVAWTPYIYEQWAIAQIPTDVTAFLKTLPSSSNFHYTWNKNLVTGDFSDDVKFAQIAFMILGLLKTVTSDEFGHFGPKTAAANMAYQSSKGIIPTAPSSIGPKTRDALNKQFA